MMRIPVQEAEALSLARFRTGTWLGVQQFTSWAWPVALFRCVCGPGEEQGWGQKPPSPQPP